MGKQTAAGQPRRRPDGREDTLGGGGGPGLTACTGAAMSRWTQTPGQSKPMCEAMKRPAQELGLLSRSWGGRGQTMTVPLTRGARLWALPRPLGPPHCHPQPPLPPVSEKRGLGEGPVQGGS